LIMLRATTRNVATMVTAFYDRNPTRTTVRAGAALHTYHAGCRPGEVGPVRPSTRAMSPDQDRALLLLSVGSVTVAQVIATMGAFAHRMLRALRDLTSRGLAVFAGGAFQLAEVQ